ncbi:AAA family ATPase [Conexibacter sp. W3-3-2]|uniref:ATP-binding protein n=1 Tax=Conexibacter sp. W3-3-2 TaxID=2675227 RepID=UPI0012B6FE69|nr:ATP-binding protein [Conexibacter sp. W3-3-2]MTD46098.1 AAA family ATPase [Conexibacter sp. W3-3-2]
MTTTTLGQRLARRDAQRFVGRETELSRLAALLDDADAPASVVLVHGPSGIGKSTLLREIGRRAAASGRPVHRVEGRDIAPVPGELDAALDGVSGAERPVVLLDTYERLAATGTHLRRRVLPALPEGSLVVIAGRRTPEPEWFQDGWESVTTSLELGPLDESDALALVQRHGITDEAAADTLVRWSLGSPLALAVGLDAAGGTARAPHLVAPTLDGRPDLARTLVQRIAGPEIGAGDREVLAVAAIARVCTRELLEEVLPHVDARRAERWLRERSFSERVGDGIALHDLLRRAVRAELRAGAPELECRLRARITDHIHGLTRTDGLRRITDLAELMDAEALRWGFGAEGSVTHRLDGPRAGDTTTIAHALADRFGPGVWDSHVRPFIERAPEHVVMARDASDRLAGYCISATPRAANPVVRRDPLLGPWLEHAAEQDHSDQTLVWRDSTDLTSGREGNVHSPVIALMNTAAMLRCGLPNIRRSYLPIDPENPVARAFAQGAGAVHVPHLDVRRGGGRVIQCHVLEHGEGGVLQQLRDVIHAEIAARAGERAARGEVAGDEGDDGLVSAPAPARRFVRTGSATVPGPVAPAADADAGRPVVTADDIRLALRRYHRPLDLAASPLAPALGTPAERAAAVRAELDRAVREGFGDSVDERLLAQTIRRGYFDPDGGHERAALDLNVSRATYFRKLREACDRVADAVLAAR